MPCRALIAAALWLCACPSTVDLSVGRAYPCDPDAGSSGCPPEMRCGLDARCHALGFPAAYGCRDDGDCEAGWRCGLNQTCHARDVAGAYACHLDSDCELDWRC